MNKHQEIRTMVRQVLNESVNNFLQKEPATATKQLDDNFKPQEIGDPLSAVKMNQMANETGSDGKNAPTVAVKAGGAKGGNDPLAGQPLANFQDKTELAEATILNTEEDLTKYILKAINEKYDKAIEEELKEGVVEGLMDAPAPKGETDEIEESGRSKSLGRITNLKPKNYPAKLKR